MKKILLAIIGIFLIATVTSLVLMLYPYSPLNPPHANDIGANQEDIKKIVDSNNKFAFDFYSELDKSENIFYSPYSIYSAFGMVYEGARTDTAEEIKEVFYFPEYEILRPNFAAIYNIINSKDNPYELRTGNALWLEKEYTFVPEFLKNTEDYYGGKAAILDFIAEAESSRQTINNFIEEQTNSKIKDLIPRGSIDGKTRLVLTNAVYFKGDWEWEFDESKTREENFYSPLKTQKTKMMFMNPEKTMFNYLENEELQIIELPYKGENISMYILLPKNDSIANLKDEKYQVLKSEMQKTKLDFIMLPKFEFTSKYSLIDNMKNMGINLAFSDNADFSGINSNKDLFISDALHQAYIKVDEKGTEAAAATAIIMAATSAGPSKMNYFKADKPFIFIIEEKQTGTILFMGKLVYPSD